MINSRKLKQVVVEKFSTRLSGKIFIGDKTYSIPNKSWIKKEYYNIYKKFMQDNQLYQWKENNDCDQFASIYRILAQSLHAKQLQSSAESITVGEMWYMKDGYGGHAINLVVVDNFQVMFIEPQNGVQLNLTQEELNTCWLIRF